MGNQREPSGCDVRGGLADAIRPRTHRPRRTSRGTVDGERRVGEHEPFGVGKRHDERMVIDDRRCIGKATSDLTRVARCRSGCSPRRDDVAGTDGLAAPEACVIAERQRDAGFRRVGRPRPREAGVHAAFAVDVDERLVALREHEPLGGVRRIGRVAGAHRRRRRDRDQCGRSGARTGDDARRPRSRRRRARSCAACRRQQEQWPEQCCGAKQLDHTSESVTPNGMVEAVTRNVDQRVRQITLPIGHLDATSFRRLAQSRPGGSNV